MLQVILIFGISVAERAFVESSLRPGRLDLNLDRKNITLWWQGYDELRFKNLEILEQVGSLPSDNFIHYGEVALAHHSQAKISLAIIKLLRYTWVGDFNMYTLYDPSICKDLGGVTPKI